MPISESLVSPEWFTARALREIPTQMASPKAYVDAASVVPVLCPLSDANPT